MSKKKYILTHAIAGMRGEKVVELTEEQAQHPLYRTRIRPADTSVAVETGLDAAALQAENDELKAELEELKGQNEALAAELEAAKAAPEKESKAAEPANKGAKANKK